MQMTAQKAGALQDGPGNWQSIDWKLAQRHVRRLQMRIAKAVKESRWNKVRSLQYLLTHSFYAKLLAVKRVTSPTRGKRPPALTASCGKASEPNGGLHAACADVVIGLSL
jgi:RNA-directed DNA polymerase